MIRKEDFFKYEKEILYVPEEDYLHAQLCVETLEAFARTTYSSIYVIDRYRKNFL